jgi:hypothetical protein
MKLEDAGSVRLTPMIGAIAATRHGVVTPSLE